MVEWLSQVKADEMIFMWAPKASVLIPTSCYSRDEIAHRDCAL